MQVKIKRPFKFQLYSQSEVTSKKIDKIYEYDIFEKPTQGSFTTDYTAHLNMYTRAISNCLSTDNRFLNLRHARARIEVCRLVQRIWLKKNQIISLSFTRIYYSLLHKYNNFQNIIKSFRFALNQTVYVVIHYISELVHQV